MLNIMISMVFTIAATTVSMNWLLLLATFALIIIFRLVILYFEFMKMKRKGVEKAFNEGEITDRYKDEAD
ncbi:MAG: hypothetical protein MSH43_04100 [Bacteroidales bacterium]|jgi:high-affinity nickel permease|nr:hypothetical protein [Bacteroidales bacterium]MDD7277032.1 hypothetical protein [Bacteroidales bacterium]